MLRKDKLIVYRTAGNIGGQLNLAVWRLGKQPSNLNPSNLSATYANKGTRIICTELPPNLNQPIFRLLRTKPPNLKIANISGYTVIAIIHFPSAIFWKHFQYAVVRISIIYIISHRQHIWTCIVVLTITKYNTNPGKKTTTSLITFWYCYCKLNYTPLYLLLRQHSHLRTQM